MKDCLKIIAVSDSHGDREVLNWISQTEYDADFFLHLGDSELTPAALYQYVAVAGNRDMPNLFPITRRIKTVYGDIFMEHGLKLLTLGPNQVQAQDASIYLYGHTHCHRLDTYAPGRFLANPGSVTRPRDGTNGTYLRITLKAEGPDFEFVFL